MTEQLNLQMIGSGARIEIAQIKPGDQVMGYYLGKYCFDAVVTENRSVSFNQNGRHYFINKLGIKLLTPCQRPQNGQFEAGEEIEIILTGKSATELLIHSRPL